MTAYLFVRAQVDPSVHDQFDTWYRDEHLPDAKKAFSVLSAQRGWSTLEPDVHIAMYEFPDLATAKAATSSEKIAELIAEFDRHWLGKVTRTREVVEFIQKI